MEMPSWMFSRTRSFIYGVTLPLSALRLIAARPVLIFWSVVPIGLTLGLYYYLIRWIDTTMQGFLQNYFASLGWNPNGWAAVSVWIFAKLFMIIVAALSFSVSASILASPFNDWLAECSEPWTTPPLPKAPSFSWRGKARLIGIDVLKSLLALVGTLLALVVAWVPVLNLVALLSAFLLVTFQFISYPQTRRGEGIQDGLRFLWRNVFACAGLGATLSFLFAIPILSSLCLPLAVVSGTLLYAKAQGSKG
ncbi:MAG TPA: hypothetical protein DCS07_10620 [Bdellovibrionales bacterium]|nr:MAG: hypothetical protein A2Z97_06290 [Bdellovibrionales bacterium GWB1_52_6]OFZ06111.1 MAG: hypothetical protein A2X97_02130 [Bdellovibrionales bacterium GWA1_52_35]OFZ42278.1 MAG: hypothetical protein A2070_14055 [Bdellovibrionales bacterium GWC1_52_8]HAR43063.1 hypothetical protein [Bdellovibrionales bacterium]HCM39260.1 hypothetical protein [Bdellovibrionales bacterium]